MHVYPKRWCLSTKQHVVEIKDRYIHSHPHHRLKSVSSFTWPRQLCCCCKEHNGCVFYCMKHIDTAESVTWCFSDRASWIDYILITNLMHWSLFIHKILFSSTCFEPQVLIFRMIQLYTCSIWYCHSVLLLWLLFIHKILFSSTCFESQVLIFRMIQLYTCSVWYCHSLWESVHSSHCELCTDRPPGTLIEGDSTICCMCTTVSSWRLALEVRNM